MAYNGTVDIVHPNDRNLNARLREGAVQDIPVLYFNPATSVWNWKDIAGVNFAGAGINPDNPLPDLVTLRAALDPNGLDIP